MKWLCNCIQMSAYSIVPFIKRIFVELQISKLKVGKVRNRDNSFYRGWAWHIRNVFLKIQLLRFEILTLHTNLLSSFFSIFSKLCAFISIADMSRVSLSCMYGEWKMFVAINLKWKKEAIFFAHNFSSTLLSFNIKD